MVEKSEKVEKNRAWPQANNKDTKDILALLNQASQYKQLKKGANESTKALNKGMADLVVLAADTEPLEIILHLPLLCEDKNVVYVYVPKQADLGRACGVSRNIVAATILRDPEGALHEKVQKLKDKVEAIVE